MSYSVNAKASNKKEVLDLIRKAMDDVIGGQPEHTTDVPAVFETCKCFVDTVHLDADHDITVSASGSLSWPVAGQISSVSANINVNVVKREPSK